MQLLTTSGYKLIEDCAIGENLIAYDITTGAQVINQLEAKEWLSPDMFEDEYDVETGVIVKTKEQIFEDTYGSLDFSLVNNTWTLFKNQSVWANLRVVHTTDLQIGDTLYNDQDQDITITSISSDTAAGWWRLTVSGDHSYIADNLSLHNANRYWVGGGSSANWNATANTNWGSTSGTQDNASVPTNVDAVIFDGAGVGGNTNSTISATITILSLNITTGYTSTMTHNAVLTIAGNWTYTGSYTIAGTSGITISANSTITSNGVTWPNPLTFSNANTKTLSGNLTVSGLLTVSGTTTLNKTTSETLTLSGGITANALLSGTAKVILTGGTWSGSGGAISNTLDLQGNVTISGSVGYNTSTITYVSGTITVTGSTLVIGSCTLNTPGITWNNISLSSGTITLASNLDVNGTLTIGGTVTANKTASEKITVAGGITVSTKSLIGTDDVYITGGTWSSASSGFISSNFYINGNVTFGTTVSYRTGTLTYLSGTVTTTGSTLYMFSSTTLNTNGITWNNIISNNTNTFTLTSNLSMSGLFTVSNPTTINTSVGSTWTTSGGITVSSALSGTAKVILTGGTWSGIAFTGISNNLDIQGNVTISGNVTYLTNTLTYVSGTVTTTGSTFYLSASCTLNTNGITWNNVISDATGKTITLTSNFLTSGLFTISGNTTINTSVGATLTTSGGMAINNVTSGTAKVILTGGTWSGTNSTGITNNLDLQGNVTVSGNVYYNTGTMTYVSGTITTTSSTLNIVGSTPTLNTSGITWNNVTSNATTKTITLTSNFSMSGLLTVTGSTTINKTVSETFTIAGGVSGNGGMAGTAKVVLTGGTWTGTINLGGISNDLDINGNVTISGALNYGVGTLTYVSGTVTTTGSTLNIQNISTTTKLNTNGITWDAVTFNTQSKTVTLTSNLSMSGLMTVTNGATTINSTTSETITVAGGITIGTSGVSGTAKIILTGGTINTSSYIRNNLDIQGNVTVNGTFYYGLTTIGVAPTLKYVSGTVTTTGSTLGISVSILDTNGIIWNDVLAAGISPTTLASDLNMSGILYGSPTGQFLINKTTSEKITCYGVRVPFRLFGGTANLYLKGGTWQQTAVSPYRLSFNTYIDGNVTISGTVLFGEYTLTYLSGNVTTTGSTIAFTSNAILDVNGISWNNLTFVGNPITLNSNVLINGLLDFSGSIFRANTDIVIIANGGLTAGVGGGGASKIILRGGTWSNSASAPIAAIIDLDGDITLGSSISCRIGPLTYVSGKITTNNTILDIAQGTTSTVLNFDKIPLKAVTMRQGFTLIVNKFFTGTPGQICDVKSTSGTANFTLAFQDDFEKIAKNVSIRNCTLANPGQLLVTTNSRFNTGKESNVGIRYINQSPNGFSRKVASLPDASLTTPALGLVGDPNFVKQG